jgi:phospholipase C
VEFTLEQVRSLIVEPGAGGLTGVRALKASSEHVDTVAANALDGDPATIWHTHWGDNAPGFPHELAVEFEAPRQIAGVTLLPRQDGNSNGWINAYELYTSADGQNWGAPLAQGEFAADAQLKKVSFAAPVSARFLKLRALSGHANGPWASLAELGVLPPAPK